MTALFADSQFNTAAIMQEAHRMAREDVGSTGKSYREAFTANLVWCWKLARMDRNKANAPVNPSQDRIAALARERTALVMKTRLGVSGLARLKKVNSEIAALAA